MLSRQIRSPRDAKRDLESKLKKKIAELKEIARGAMGDSWSIKNKEKNLKKEIEELEQQQRDLNGEIEAEKKNVEKKVAELDQKIEEDLKTSGLKGDWINFLTPPVMPSTTGILTGGTEGKEGPVFDWSHLNPTPTDATTAISVAPGALDNKSRRHLLLMLLTESTTPPAIDYSVPFPIGKAALGLGDIGIIDCQAGIINPSCK